MLKARHHWFLYPFFNWYSGWLVKRHFKSVIIRQKPATTKGPILLVMNHTGWWDGFWAQQLNQTLFKKRFYFMMLEQQLRKYWYFKFCGGFSIKPGSLTIVESIDFARKILSSEDNLLLMFPQGKLHSTYLQNYSFEPGITRILDNKDVRVVFAASFVEYLQHRKPSVYIYLDEYTYLARASAKEMADAYNRFYSQSLAHQQNITQ